MKQTHMLPSRLRRVVPVLVAAGLLSSACGSQLTHEEVLALNSTTNAAASSPESAGQGLDTGALLDGESLIDGSSPAGGSTGQPTVTTPGAAAGGTGGAPSGPATGTPIILGNIGNYSGVVGAIYGKAQPGIRAWAKSVNDRGGINGHPVQLITADDGGDPNKALSLVRDFVENRGVIAFVGNLTTLSVSGYRQYIEANRIPVVGGDTVTPDWEQSPMLFPQGAQAKGQHLGTLALAVRQGHTKTGVVHCVEVFACVYSADIQEAGASSLGAEMVYRAGVSLVQPDFTSECIAARNKGVEHLFVAMDGNGVRRMIDSCATQNYRPQFSAPSIALVADVLASPNVNGLQSGASNFPFPATDTEAAKEFDREIRRITGRAPASGPEAVAWVSGKLFELAGKDLPDDPTNEDVLEGLWRIKNQDLGGLTVPLTFNRDAPATVGPCYFVLRIENQRFTAPEGSKRTCF